MRIECFSGNNKSWTTPRNFFATTPIEVNPNKITFAQKVLNAGPAVWDKKQIDNERFLITDVLDDQQFPLKK
jgi:hypothetical protein